MKASTITDKQFDTEQLEGADNVNSSFNTPEIT